MKLTEMCKTFLHLGDNRTQTLERINCLHVSLPPTILFIDTKMSHVSQTIHIPPRVCIFSVDRMGIPFFKSYLVIQFLSHILYIYIIHPLSTPTCINKFIILVIFWKMSSPSFSSYRKRRKIRISEKGKEKFLGNE